MSEFIEKFWQLKLVDVKQALEKNNFQVFIAKNEEIAKEFILAEIIAKHNPASISWGGSLTFIQTKLYHFFKQNKNFKIIDTYDKTISPEEMLENRRKSLLVDLYFTGTNAITENGWLVNLDMIGNRVGALSFGPKKVVVIAGRNKIVKDLDDAIVRIKNYSAPANVMRLNKKTPCLDIGKCVDCSSPDRICNVWTIMEKCYPKHRVCVVIIDKELGL
ncbi:MAG: lactate utilization protein [Desulfonauticus sp.]|nr:lactate utilization protein [Desulfonauticus sp.]